MPLSISQTSALIGIDRTPGRLDVQTVNARLELHHKEAKVNIHTELPQIQIDQHDAFSSAGLKSPFELTQDAAERGRQAVLDYIGKTASDGDRLAAIELGGNPLSNIAERDSKTVHEFGYDYIPKVGPKITLKEGHIDIEPEPNGAGAHNGVEADFSPGDVNFNYTPTVISVYMKQYPSINISYRPGDNVDLAL